MLRRLAIVAFLFWAMAHAARVAGEGVGAAGPMLAFGFVVLAAATLGELAHRFHLPHVSGYLLSGVAFGRYGLGLLSPEVVHQLKLFDILAIGLIAMEAGATLDLASLRERWRGIAVLTGAMVATSAVGGLALAGGASGVLPGVALPFLEGGGAGLVLATGLLFGVMMLAASPPVTLAVAHEARARGEFTETLFNTVIINNVQVVVLFAFALAGAQALTGAAEVRPAEVGLQLAWSLALAAGIAGAAALAIRAVPRDALLAIVGLAFVGHWLATAVGASPLLTFLAAGAILNGATRQGPRFKEAAQTLSGPVYVLFFTLVGADLHVDALREMAPFAVALVLARLGAFQAAVVLADRLAPLHIAMRRFGALALAPQAGIALTVALAVGEAFPGWGEGFATLGLAAIALNEMAGPVLLKLAFQLSGEAGARDRAEAGEEAGEEPEAAEPPPEWREDEPTTEEGGPWAFQPRTGIARVDEVCREAAAEARSLVRDLRAGVVAARRREALSLLQQLRREVLVAHRRLGVRVRDDGDTPEEFREAVRVELADLARRWRAALLDRASRVRLDEEQRALDGLVAGLDRIVEELPPATTGRMRPEDLADEPGEPPWRRAHKRWLRARLRMARLLGGDGPLRVVPVREVARFHLSGRLPPALEETAALLALAERTLLERLGGLVHEVLRSARALADEPGATPEERRARVAALRAEVEEGFRAVAAEVDRLAAETARAAERAVAGAVRSMAEDCARAGTPRLPAHELRYSRVYRARLRAAERRRQGFAAARTIARGMAAALAMELELARLREELAGLVERTADESARDVHGRLAIQFGRIEAALGEAIASLRGVLRARSDDPGVLLRAFDEVVAPLTQLVDGTVHVVEQYQHDLEAHSPFEVLSAAAALAMDQLTDRFTVVLDPPPARGRALVLEAEPATIPFREVVRTWFEAQSGPALAAIAESLNEQVERARSGIRDLDRALVFTAELVHSELEMLPDGVVPPAAFEVLEDTLLGTLTRIRHRVEELRAGGEELAERTRREVVEATLGRLEQLAALLTAGRIAEIRAAVAQHALVAGAREIRGLEARARRLLGRVRGALGDEFVAGMRRFAGIEAPPAVGDARFAVPEPTLELPLAYRRLFSDPALEAGDILAGREAEVSGLRKLLLGERPGRRAVAVIAVGGMGKEAVVGALLRGLAARARVERHVFREGPVSLRAVDQVAHQARALAQGARRAVVVVEGLEWLFEVAPGGFAALRRLLRAVVETSDRVGWLISADRPVWAYADAVTHLHDAFPVRFELEPLDAEGLRHAILARHAMSGYRLRFVRVGTRGPAWWRRRGAADLEERFFRELHRDSGGILGDALRLWMASIVRIEEETVVVGPPPQPPVEELGALGLDDLLTLRQVARQGRITAREHASQFRLEREASLACLARLEHQGLLERRGEEVFAFHPGLAGPLYRVLHARRLVG